MENNKIEEAADAIYESVYMEVVELVEKDNRECDAYINTATKLMENYIIQKRPSHPEPFPHLEGVEENINEFERYPKLTEFMQEYASSGRFSNWTDFIGELNNALKKYPKEPLEGSEEKEVKLIELEANIFHGKFNFIMHNHNVGFSETEAFLNLVKNEAERQLSNKEQCPFYEK